MYKILQNPESTELWEASIDLCKHVHNNAIERHLKDNAIIRHGPFEQRPD